MRVLERLIRNSDNQIKLILTEDGDPIAGAWEEISVHIGRDVVLTRTASGDGIEFSETGVLIIIPADLMTSEIAALDALPIDTYQRVRIVLTSVLNDQGVVFGGSGSTAIIFHVSDKPVAA